MHPQNSRLQAIIVVGILLVVILAAVYNAGLSRGRLAPVAEALTAQADLVALATPSPDGLAGAEAITTPERSPAEQGIVLLPTNTETPGPPPTETSTPTPTHSPTPTQTATPTTTPASPQEWAQRYQAVAVQALNELSISDFSPDRGQALLRRIAQEQGLIFVPAAYYLLQGPTWGVVVVPRTPQDQALPMIFWREPNEFNRIRSQLLLDALSVTSSGYDFSRFYGGISHGVLRADYIGRFHLLLIEHPEAYPRLAAHVLMQNQPAGGFERLWYSAQEPFWTQRAGGSRVQLVDSEGAVLPDIEVYAPLDRGRDLRDQVGAGDAILEQTPFARQWAETRWRFITVEGALDLSGVVEPGYNLQSATLVQTPLTTLSRFIQLLQAGNVSGASDFTTRFDLMQEAFNLGLGDPGEWLALYLDENDRPLFGPDYTERIRLFDNRNRNRVYTIRFERTTPDGPYRVAAVNAGEPYLASDLVTPVPPSAGGEAVAMADTPATEPEPTETPTPTPVPTETGTPTQTLTPLPTPTETATPVDTALPTSTPLPTDTPTPGPLPNIPAEETASASAIVFRSPANLRGGPDTSYPSVAQMGYGVNLDLFGVTEVGNWVVVRINDPGHPQNGVVGWIAQDLLQLTSGDYAELAGYSVEGIALIPPTPGPTPTPEPTLPPTPRPTPALTQPGVSPLADQISPPGPGADERVLTVEGEQIPANPYALLAARDEQGTAFQLVIDRATVQIWNGTFGINPPDWAGAPAELLWPNSEIYVVGTADELNPSRIVAQRIRIARPPSLERVRMTQSTEFAAALGQGAAVAMMGSREEPGIYLLESGGTGQSAGALRQLWVDEQEAAWAGVTTEEGVVISLGGESLGRNRLTWTRGDGQTIQINAQPFHAIQGFAGDLFGGLWWIERPQADVEQWQLWHYDTQLGQIRLRFRANGEVFSTGGQSASPAMSPVLLAAQPTLDPESGQVTGVTLWVDTMEGGQRLYAGVYRLSMVVARDGAGMPGAASLGEPAQLLLEADSYRGPIRVNSEQTRLAYFVYDPDHPSLTSGFIRPANAVRVLSLDGAEAGTIRTVYASENRFEFLAPNLAWQGNDRLIVARSRFAAGDVFALDRFGITQIQLPVELTGEVVANSYLFPNLRDLRDFAVCRNDGHVLTITGTETGELELGRWSGSERPIPLFLLPPNQTRAFLCWQAPDSLFTGP